MRYFFFNRLICDLRSPSNCTVASRLWSSCNLKASASAPAQVIWLVLRVWSPLFSNFYLQGLRFLTNWSDFCCSGSFSFSLCTAALRLVPVALVSHIFSGAAIRSNTVIGLFWLVFLAFSILSYLLSLSLLCCGELGRKIFRNTTFLGFFWHI